MEKIIQQKLIDIEEREQVRIIFAIESGSRAWGFASADSDYDVRFVYVRPYEAYLRLEPTRDVIEWQLDDTLDINGWDLQKALRLMHDSNPSLFEWMTSPIVYRSSAAMDELKALGKTYYSPKKNLYHYWHMASTNFYDFLQDDEVKLKKYFYILRPILAAKWVVSKQTQPPMLFSELVAAELPAEQRRIVDELLAIKKHTPERKLIPRNKILHGYIEREIEAVKKAADAAGTEKKPWSPLNDYFITHVMAVK